ncbi:MAG: DUF4010 domain-containing protein, partial [Gemmatimonadaceae bacterium]
ALLIAATYLAATRRPGSTVDGTTEVASIIVIALGVLSGMGEITTAGGAGAIVVLALSEKEGMRSVIKRINEVELRAALQFSVLALVILPILPNELYGPLGGVNPRTLWIVVLLFSGLNFVGWISRHAVGASRGYGVTGALGGLISSTAVSLQFSRASRASPQLANGLGVGVVAASTILLPRVLVLSTLLNRDVAVAVVPYVLAPFVAGAIWCAIWIRRARHDKSSEQATANSASPLRLWSAIRLTLAFQAALMALAFMRHQFGSGGVLVSAGVLGLTDMDALTLSMNRLGASPEAVPLAAQAIAIGICANAVLKLGLTLVLGESHFRRVASVGLFLLLVVGVGSIVALW